jgi:hypothetical protein
MPQLSNEKEGEPCAAENVGYAAVSDLKRWANRASKQYRRKQTKE